MAFLAASAFLKALGWALLNSIWQFAFCWLLYILALTLYGKLQSAARHALALFLLFLGALLFLGTFCWKYYAMPPANMWPALNLPGKNPSWPTLVQTAMNYIDRWMPVGSLLYLACILVLFIKLCFFVQYARHLRQTSISRLPARWNMHIRYIAAQLGIRREVKAFLSACTDTPQVIGWLKPVILVPAACLTRLSPEQLEAVLLHELAHIKRNDYLLNLFVASMEILFFFHPFVRQLTAAIRKEREYCCDDMVLQYRYPAAGYAAALLILEKNRRHAVTYGIAAGGKDRKQLLTRIERLVGIGKTFHGFNRMAGALFVLLLLGMAAGIGTAPLPNGDPYAGPHAFAGNSIAEQAWNREPNGVKRTTAAPPYQHGGKAAASIKQDFFHDTPALSAISIPAVASPASAESGEAITPGQLWPAATRENQDFTLTEDQEDDALARPKPDERMDAPYIPSGSFSFRLIQDTGLPKIKGETYDEVKAKQALARARKAIAAIDWQRIEKDLKYNRQELDKLKKALMVQLQQLDWNRINADMRAEQGLQQLEKLKEVAQQNQVLQQYRQKEAYFESLQKYLEEQTQLIRLSDERVQQAQKSASEQQQKLQLEMKKKRIIYL